MSSRSRSPYSGRFRARAVRLARETSIRRAADDLAIPVGTLNGWIRQGIQPGEAEE